MANMSTLLCVSLCGLVVMGAPSSNCPPGGKYFDKHLGQHGRWQCCSELCEARVYRDLCLLRCPDYEQDKASATLAQQVMDQRSPEAADTSAATVIAPIIIITIALSLFSAFLGFVLYRRRQKRNGGHGRVTGQSVHMTDLERRASDAEQTDSLVNSSSEDFGGVPGNGQHADGSSERSDRTERKSHACDTPRSSDHGYSQDQTAKEEAGPPIQVVDETDETDKMRPASGPS